MVGSKVLGATCLLLAALVEAHPGPHAEPDAALLRTRSVKADICASQIGALKQKRHALRKREAEMRRRSEEETAYEIHAEAPAYPFIKNTSVIMMPETTQGPYWLPSSQILRQNMVDGEPGVPLELEIGVIDVNTCEPLEGVLIDLWHCNATGSYSSFTLNDPNTPFGELVQQLGVNRSDPDWDTRSLQTDKKTFGRAMWPTNENGVTSFSSIFPGFYVQRSIHIHVQAHTNWTIAKNGTVATSDVVETGQIFFAEPLTQEIMALEPYVSHTEILRFPNDIDGIYLEMSEGGAPTVADTEPLDGEDYANGVLGYITLAIDPTEIKNGSSASGGGWGLPATNVSYYTTAWKPMESQYSATRIVPTSEATP